MMGNPHTRLMLAFPLLLLSPTAHADLPNLSGTWLIHQGTYSDRLHLSPDGTYRRLSLDGRGLGHAETGSWILSRVSDQVIVVLRPAAGWPETQLTYDPAAGGLCSARTMLCYRRDGFYGGAQRAAPPEATGYSACRPLTVRTELARLLRHEGGAV